jgi:hypothetical protein
MKNKSDLLNVFENYSKAADFFKITRGAISHWDFIPKLRLFEMEQAGLIKFDKKSNEFNFNKGK